MNWELLIKSIPYFRTCIKGTFEYFQHIKVEVILPAVPIIPKQPFLNHFFVGFIFYSNKYP